MSTLNSEESIEEFERKFAQYIGVNHAVAVSSGTAGLMVAMMAFVSGPGQSVVTTPLTFIATANSALVAGGIPLFADVQRETLNLDPSKALGLPGRNERTVFVPVHLYGLPADIESIRRERNPGEVIIEDAAQSLGASVGGRKIGSQGELCVFSFYSTKHIPLGEGGMITTNDESVAEKCRMIRSHGQQGQYYHVILGYNFRMPHMLALRGIELLSGIDRIVEKRRKTAEVYMRELKDIPGLTFQLPRSNVRHAYYKFPILLDLPVKLRASDVARALTKKTRKTIGTGYGRLIYQQPLYQNMANSFWAANFLKYPDYNTWHCPIAEELISKIVELPTDESVDSEKAVAISEAFRSELKVI